MDEQRENELAASLLRNLRGPRPGAEARVRARLSQAPAPSRPLWPVFAGVALVAALGLIAINLPTTPAPEAPPEAPQRQALAADATWAELDPVEGVRMSYQGNGALDAADKDVAVDWRQGTIHVEVEPDQGLKVQVKTQEASVRVIGTGFSVTRTRKGTDVQVRHGKVSVRCESGEEMLLEAGQSGSCLPATPVGFLGRANALVEEQADPAQILAACDAGLALGASGYTSDELRVLRLEALVQLGRRGEARGAAEDWLATGGDFPRRPDVERLAASLR